MMLVNVEGIMGGRGSMQCCSKTLTCDMKSAMDGHSFKIAVIKGLVTEGAKIQCLNINLSDLSYFQEFLLMMMNY